MFVSNNPIIGLSTQIPSTPQSAATHVQDLESLPLPTWVYRPTGFDQAADESLPVLIMLHGTGPQGLGSVAGLNDLLTRDGTTVTTEINSSLTGTPSDYPHNIVTFSPYKTTGDWDIQTIASLVQSVLDNRVKFKIDPTRIFLTGLSLGGIGISGYVFLQDNVNINYVPIAGIFPMAGGSGGVGATEAQQAVDKNILIRGWLGDNEPNGFATVMTGNATQANAIQANYYELNTVVGGTHSASTWGVPYGDHGASSIYADVENSTSSNTIPSNVIERYATRRYRHDDVLQQDGTTPAAVNDAVYEFVDFSRFGRNNLPWIGLGTPPIRDANGYIEIGTANDIEWGVLQNAELVQPITLWLVMDDLAGEVFDTYVNNQGAIVQANGSNLRLNAGSTGTFSGGRPADGVTTILQANFNGSNGELFINNVANASNPQNVGTNKMAFARIGTNGGGANWRFREMFFTPLLDSSISTQIYNALDAIYP